MSKSNHKNGRRTIAIEICRTDLVVAILETSRDGRSIDVCTKEVQWRHESNTLHSEQGQHELGAALKALASKEKLNGCKVSIALSGDYSVTRVVAGGAERVRHELKQLEERSSLYLSLGPGAKTVAGAVRQIDVRHQHAWLSATNKKTLDAVLRAAEVASLEVDVVEPSLIALCRALGETGADQASPVLIIEVDERSVELGICYQGRLLLDHRPAGVRGPEGLAEIVDQHMERLRRYCTRHFRYAIGDLKEVYLCGADEAVDKLEVDFNWLGCLTPRRLDPQKISEHWSFANSTGDSAHLAALGAALGSGKTQTERNGPNLMERLRSELREPLLQALIRTAWPIAASLLIAVILYGVNTYQRIQGDETEQQLNALKPAEMEVRKMQVDLTAVDNKARELEKLAAGVRHSDWNKLITHMAQCLPEDVWLETFYVDSQGNMTISGNSYSEDGVLEFVRWLKETPTLNKVALQSTKPFEADTGPATRFDVKCNLAGHNDGSAEEGQDG